MTDPSTAVQKAIYEALSASLAPVQVYDHVPQNTEHPYVSLDAQDIEPKDFLSDRMDERRFYLSVWSRYNGQAEVLGIMEQIGTAIHQKALPMENGTMIRAYVIRKRTTLDSDGETYQGSVTLRVLTQH